MANEMQRGNLTGTAIMRMPISGTVSIGGKQMKELRFMPYSEFPEEGREDVLYIDTDGNAMYYWDGTEYIALSGGGSGGTSNYNELSNKPSINDITLTGNKTSADLGLQPTISDLATIRSGAASGATAVQPSDMETALVNKQDVISDLDTIRSGATAGNTALQPEDIDTLPTDGSSNPVSSGGTYNFVNSSIATNTAYFIGTFASVAELEAYSGTVTNNDYAFVTSTDSAGNTLYNRYKYNAATQVWSFEYAVNNTSFTTAQWAAIQSGLTASDKTKLDGIEQGANKTVIDASPTSESDNAVSSGGVHTALSGKQDTIADLSDIRSGASAGATAVQPSALTDYQTKLSGTNKLDPSYIDYDVSHRAVSDTEKSTWNGKQDVISDLSTIRSGAAAGATALQQSDVSSTYSASGTAPVNGTAVNAAIETLDVSSVGGFGKYISAISEENGKIEATPTTFDTSLSSSSTNNNAPTSKTVYDDQQRQEVEIGVVANRGAKNFLDVQRPTATTRTSYTPLANGGVELSCSNATWTSYAIADIPVEVGKEYIITFLLDESSGTSNFYFFLRNGDSSGTNLATKNYGSTTGNYEVSFTPSNSVIWLGIYLNNSATAATATAKLRCMIRPASITDPAFAPYARTNAELTAKEQQNENNILLNTKYGGGRNVGNFAYYGLNHDQSIAAGTITYTESNGVFTFTGAADSSKDYACYLLKKQLIKAGNYVVSGISGGSTSTYWFRIGTGISDTFKMNVTDSGTILTLNSDTKITLQLVVKSGVSLSNKVFSPMIITAADWANSHDFQQYGESNAQLSSIVQVDIDNMTEFKFAKLDELSSSVHFKYGFLIGGGGASSPNKVMLWHIFVNTSNSVYFTKIIGDDAMTLTGSISDGVLTITSSATIYGGLRLIWLG